MLSNSGERWLISITDMPEPRQSSNSSRMRSSTESGNALGPALKLKTRFTEIAEAVDEDTIWNPLCDDSMAPADENARTSAALQNITAGVITERSIALTDANEQE